MFVFICFEAPLSFHPLDHVVSFGALHQIAIILVVGSS